MRLFCIYIYIGDTILQMEVKLAIFFCVILCMPSTFAFTTENIRRYFYIAYNSTNLHENRSVNQQDNQELTSPSPPEIETESTPCTNAFAETEFVLFENSSALLLLSKTLVKPEEFVLLNHRLCLLEIATSSPGRRKIKDCPGERWSYMSNEYAVLGNGSVMLIKLNEILEPGTYMFDGKKLKTCAPELDEDYYNSNYDGNGSTVPHLAGGHGSRYSSEISVNIGIIGSVISVVALCAHLVIFATFPTLRNPAGYNLASLSLSLALGYFFNLLGQIRQIIDEPCIAMGVLAYYFFLSSFFWMNCMSFDVFRSLRLATSKLIIASGKTKAKRFLYNSMYSWLTPLILVIIAVVADNTDLFPYDLRPSFGKDEICWFSNDNSKGLFMLIPAFTLFVFNGVFFAACAFLITRNRMKEKNEDGRTAQRNFFLYLRLALLMGITWMFGVLGVIFKSDVIWLIFDLLNSPQGLYVFLLFSCSRKVRRTLARKISVVNTGTGRDSVTKSESR